MPARKKYSRTTTRRSRSAVTRTRSRSYGRRRTSRSATRRVSRAAPREIKLVIQTVAPAATSNPLTEPLMSAKRATPPQKAKF